MIPNSLCRKASRKFETTPALWLIVFIGLLITLVSAGAAWSKAKASVDAKETELEPSPPYLRPIKKSGRWREYKTHRFDESLGDEQRRQISELEAIGYLAGSQAAPGAGGVLVHDTERARPGLNFYTSGHDTEASLMTMERSE